MTDDLALRRILARLDAHATAHPELLDPAGADPGDWLTVLEAELGEEPEQATRPDGAPPRQGKRAPENRSIGRRPRRVPKFGTEK